MYAKRTCIFFGLGSESISLCVREGKGVLLLYSLLIDSEFASVKQAALCRRQIVQELITKKREKWQNKQARNA